MRKLVITLLVIVHGTMSFAQLADGHRYLSLGYSGGMITHPGFNTGYLQDVKSWEGRKENIKSIRVGLTLGAYFHRNFQNAVYLTPSIEYNRINAKGRIVGFGLNTGYQLAFIPNSYEKNEEGIFQNITLTKSQFIIAPYLNFGKQIQLFGREMEYYIKPQLQFRAPHVTGMEKYFLMNTGLNVKI